MNIDLDQIRERLILLEIEHRDLDVAIEALVQNAGADDLQLRRLKKRKLQIKDQIIQLKMQIVADIPA